jgi:hypothetical protein
MLPTPTYFEKCTQPVTRQTNDYEWAGRLTSYDGRTTFTIKYYGKRAGEYIVSETYLEDPVLVVAVAIDSGEEFVLFDESRRGYNAMFCDKFSEEMRSSRKTDSTYIDKDNESVFEVELAAYYSIDYDDEYEDFVGENGDVELIFGERISFEDLKRNGYDHFEITLTNSKGKQTIPVAPELA